MLSGRKGGGRLYYRATSQSWVTHIKGGGQRWPVCKWHRSVVWQRRAMWDKLGRGLTENQKRKLLYPEDCFSIAGNILTDTGDSFHIHTSTHIYALTEIFTTSRILCFSLLSKKEKHSSRINISVRFVFKPKPSSEAQCYRKFINTLWSWLENSKFTGQKKVRMIRESEAFWWLMWASSWCSCGRSVCRRRSWMSIHCCVTVNCAVLTIRWVQIH